MKKIIAMLLALLFVIALAACGSKTAETAPAATQAPAAEQKQETYTSSQGTVDGFDPNQKTEFAMNTSESVRTFNIGEVDPSLFATPILVTSFGQSADTSMMDAIMKRSGVKDYAFNALATDADIKNYKTVIIVCGASSKGLGAAGISEADETARAEKIMAAMSGRFEIQRDAEVHGGGGGRQLRRQVHHRGPGEEHPPDLPVRHQGRHGRVLRPVQQIRNPVSSPCPPRRSGRAGCFPDPI